MLQLCGVKLGGGWRAEASQQVMKDRFIRLKKFGSSRGRRRAMQRFFLQPADGGGVVYHLDANILKKMPSKRGEKILFGYVWTQPEAAGPDNIPGHVPGNMSQLASWMLLLTFSTFSSSPACQLFSKPLPATHSLHNVNNNKTCVEIGQLNSTVTFPHCTASTSLQ